METRKPRNMQVPFNMIPHRTVCLFAIIVSWAVCAGRSVSDDSSDEGVQLKTGWTLPEVMTGVENEIEKVDSKAEFSSDDLEDKGVAFQLKSASEGDVPVPIASDGVAAAESVASLAVESSVAAPDMDDVRQIAPKYMLDLYKKFSTDKYSHPIADIVRGFVNTHEGELQNNNRYQI